jgi:molybdate transport system substrate-binding protein
MKKVSTAIAAIVLAVIAASSACAGQVLVFAAASTTDALKEIGAKFEHDTGNQATFSFGASSIMARQIIAGAPADVFLSADQAKMEQVEKAGMVRAADVRDLLSNQLVVVMPEDSAARVDSPADLKSFASIAIADPKAVPAGVYARKWLQSRDLWDALAAKVIPLLDVRAALAAVETAAAPAGIVYRTDAAITKRVRVAYAVPLKEGPKIVYPVAPLTASQNGAAAKAFINYLFGPSSRAVFTRCGFIVLK